MTPQIVSRHNGKGAPDEHRGSKAPPRPGLGEGKLLSTTEFQKRVSGTTAEATRRSKLDRFGWNKMSETWKISADEEYERCADIKRSEIEMMKEWLTKQPHLPTITDNLIIVYLRACNFSLEKAKEAIDLNFTIRTRYPDFFANRRLDSLPKTIKNLDIMVMPERDSLGNVVLFAKLKPMELSEWSFADFVKYGVMVQDSCMWEFGSAPGYVFVHDIKNLTFSQIIQSPVNLIAANLKYAQEASACCIKGLHILNGGSIFEKLFTIIKPFMNPDVIELMKVHSNYDDLIKTIGPQAVPVDYGGQGPLFQEGTANILKLVQKYEGALVEEEKFRVDEKKRPEGSKFSDLGVQGSFRKIEVD